MLLWPAVVKLVMFREEQQEHGEIEKVRDTAVIWKIRFRTLLP